MPGHPIRTAQEAVLTEHEVEVFQDRADGMSWRKVARKYGTSTFVLDKWLKNPAVPERWPAWKALDEIAAESKAGEAEEILEDADADAMPQDKVRIAVARSELAKWHAGVLNRGRFGAANQQGGVVLNVGTLHLTAVRELNLNPPPPPPGLLDRVLEAEYEIAESEAEPTLEQLLGEA